MPQNSTSQSANEVVSSLQRTDWNEEWKRLQRIRRAADDAQYWNMRSKNFDTGGTPGAYVLRFLELAEVGHGERVLDMGCGTGSLAVPLAKSGSPVLAADFSEGMLAEVAKRMEAQGIPALDSWAEAHGSSAESGEAAGIKRTLLAWKDDWEAAGLFRGCVDVAIASRSISTDDMGEALDKLSWAATRRCCISLPTGASPRMDPRVLEICGVENLHGADHQYAWNILQNKGYLPSCSYIPSLRKDTYETLDEALLDMGRMVDDVLDPADATGIAQAKERLKAWLEGELVTNEEAGLPDGKGHAQKQLRLRHPRMVTWAFISWDV